MFHLRRQNFLDTLLCTLAFIFLLSPQVCGAVGLSVTVKGIRGRLYANSMARLKIASLVHKKDIPLYEVQRLNRQAPRDIAEALAPYGYYSVHVDKSLSCNDKSCHAEYIVKPGRVVKVRRVTIRVTGPGKKAPFFSALEKQFPLHAGDPLVAGLYEAGKKKILTTAMMHGYVHARFTEHEIIVYRQKYKADIRLILKTGFLYRFGETTSNQHIISTALFQRFLPYRQGDVYSFSLLNELQSDLFSTGYFSRVVVEPQFSRIHDREIPVVVRLLPAKKNRYSIGVGYGTDTGANVSFLWKNKILNKFGHKPSLSLQLFGQGSRLNAGYAIPVRDPRYDVVNLNLQSIVDNWHDTKSNLLSLGISANHNTPKKQYGIGVEYRKEHYRVGVTTGDAELLMGSSSLNYIFAQNRIHPKDGVRIGGTVKGAYKAFLSSTSFLQCTVSGKAIVTPVDKWRIIGRSTIGTTVMKSIHDLPPSLRFYAGGEQSVRGYAYKELGPVDASGTVIGGRYLFVSSIELERYLTPMWSVATFYDAGNAFDDIHAHFKHGIGMGVRINMPFGQIRMDVARALSTSNHPFRIYLSVGADL